MPRTSAQGRSTATTSATTSIEDYAKTIYALAEWDDADVTASAIARALEVSNPSVTLMIKKMKELDLVDHRPYAPIQLTSSGRRLALSIVRRHRLIETWLVRFLGYGWTEVHDEAERLEHAVSDTFIDRLDQLLKHPRKDPHGDPIPAADLSVLYSETTLLCRVPVGSEVFLEQVDDGVPTALDFLEDSHIPLGSLLRVGVADDDTVTIAAASPDLTQRPEGEPRWLQISHDMAHAMRVSQDVAP